MKKIQLLMVLALLLFYGKEGFSQNWQLVWADEFTNGISPDWVFETGNGSGGWGNNELQYYRQENATVENGQLVITARRENYAGYNYTSARMKTQGKKSFKYGKIEARIAMPSAMGLWPAFWMLGDNISSVGWPSCGEIDIMEHVNNEAEIHGTIHWSNQDGNYSNYGGPTAANVTNYHLYSVEWDETAIRWYLDGVQYHEVSIANGVNGTSEFHNNFFILLNMAVGGNWPGFTIDDSAFPARMMVDYVRVYQDAGGSTPPSGYAAIPGRVEAESYSAMNGVQLEGTSDAGGGQNVGWIDAGDWMDYQVNVAAAGTYQLDLRVASQPGGGQLQLRSGNTTLATVNIPATGGWQSWRTLSVNANLAAGNQTLRLYASSGGFNLNWVNFAQQSTPSFSAKIEAESYTAMSGVQTESTADAGGGQNVGWIDAGDWMVYPVNIPAAGTYTVQYRVASPNGGGRIRLDKDAGATILGEIDVPATGGWQTWTTISHTLRLEAGQQNLGINAVAGGFNLNWFTISSASSSTLAKNGKKGDQLSKFESPAQLLFPNPTENELGISNAASFKGARVKIIDAMGKEVYQGTLNGLKLDVSFLSPGLYTLLLVQDGEEIQKRFIKK